MRVGGSREGTARGRCTARTSSGPGCQDRRVATAVVTAVTTTIGTSVSIGRGVWETGKIFR